MWLSLHTVVFFSGFEIPDNHAEKLMTPKDLIEYIGDMTEATE